MSNLEIMKLYAESLAVLFAKYRELEDAISAVDDLRVEEIMTELDILKRDHNIDVIFNDLPMMISESHEGAHRIKRIVSDLRTFSRSDQGELKYVDLHEIIDFSINLVRNELKYKAKVSKEYGDLPRLLCYPQMLGQVIVNLLINAAQAIDSTGDITLRTLFEKDTAVIEISDTGCGMSELVLAHLFEPFFTTKPAGKGTGLGLSLVYSIIEKHRGDIKVKSKVGEGTTFIIRLPVDSAEIV
jgi:two-component system NtrC family sensor kinase